MGLTCYLLWGLLPIYWKSIEAVNSFEILANRIIWSLLFMIGVLLVSHKWGAFVQECRAIRADRKKLATVILAGCVITFNWGLFIWAVGHGRIVETSMGYYMNPLVNVLLGVVFLGERLTNWTKVSVALAAIGVCFMLAKVGVFPWISICLALSFGLYGYIKKTLVVTTTTSILLETLVVVPLALAYVGSLSLEQAAAWQTAPTRSIALLIGAGAATAIPLLLFTGAAKKLPLSMLGFLQYLSPTLTLLIGIFLYQESFTWGHLLSFGWIWLGLLVFTCDQFRSA
jgi:chloramphenicol-sensitive protein RarD